MTNLYQSRSSILFIMQVIFLLCYAATSLLLWVYSHYIRKPLARIMKGASEYAGGNLAYKIDVTSDDEMGYLAKTLNYMSDELNKNGEYQRKSLQMSLMISVLPLPPSRDMSMPYWTVPSPMRCRNGI